LFSLLDEVTTHLDLATIKALAVALRGFEGTVVLVTHDRWFCRVVIEGAPLREPAEDDSDGSAADEEEDEEAAAKPRGQVYRVNKGQVVELPGGMDEYVQKVAKELAKKAKTDAVLMPG
jgi:ATP-binding cassette, subfamily F, member 3